MSSLFISLILFPLELLFASCIPSAKQCGCSYQSPLLSTSRIVGGSTARKHSWPWIVSIRQTDARQPLTDPGTVICGGSLLNEKYILTAAHCFYNINPLFLSNYFIVVGAHFINDTNSVRFQIKSIKLHEKYDDDLYLYDIALVELSSTVNLNNTTVGCICLPSTSDANYPDEGMNAIAIGWGRLNENSSVSYTLQQVRLPIISNKNHFCRQQISDELIQICAGFIQGGSDTCQGDSGGPLMIYDPKTSTWHIAGITSYGNGCARAENPGVYTRVSVFTSWISKHINSASRSSRLGLSMNIFLLLCSIILFF